MVRSISLLSLLTSLFFFQINLPWIAILPLLVAMYLIFTDGQIENHKHEWSFSKYHILFALRGALIVGLGLILYTFGVPMLQILLVTLGIHMLLIWVTLIAQYKDEFTMFHIGYYFMACIIARYTAMEYGIRGASLSWLFFPIATFLLYAGGSFFIHPFVPLPQKWHYRTVMFFIISFLASVILYFFSVPMIGWASALILYTAISSFIVYQYISFREHERSKKIYAEDILEGKKVIMPPEGTRHEFQTSLFRIVHNLPFDWRFITTGLSILFLLGVFIYAFGKTTIPSLGVFLLLCGNVILFYYSQLQRSKIKYPTYLPDSMVGAFLHTIFLRTVRKYSGDFFTTGVFLTMGWSIIHHGLDILFSSQSKYRISTRKNPLLYGHMGSTVLVSGGVIFFLTQLGMEASFAWGISLLYCGIIGTMVYFFVRNMQGGQKGNWEPTNDILSENN